MGVIPQDIYERIKEALSLKEPVAVTLICPGDGTIQGAYLSRIELLPAK